MAKCSPVQEKHSKALPTSCSVSFKFIVMNVRGELHYYFYVVFERSARRAVAGLVSCAWHLTPESVRTFVTNVHRLKLLREAHFTS